MTTHNIVLFMMYIVHAQYLTVVNECVDRQGKTMDTRHKLPAIMCVHTYLNRGQNVLITINYIQTTHSSNFVYNVHHEQHNIMSDKSNYTNYEIQRVC
jgi:hypothetical protein